MNGALVLFCDKSSNVSCGMHRDLLQIQCQGQNAQMTPTKMPLKRQRTLQHTKGPVLQLYLPSSPILSLFMELETTGEHA